MAGTLRRLAWEPTRASALSRQQWSPRVQRPGHWDRRQVCADTSGLEQRPSESQVLQSWRPSQQAGLIFTDAAPVAYQDGGGSKVRTPAPRSLRVDPEALWGPRVEAGERPRVLQLLTPRSGLGAGQQCRQSGPAGPP